VGDGLGLARQVELVRNHSKKIYFQENFKSIINFKGKNKKIQIINIGQTCQLKFNFHLSSQTFENPFKIW